MNIFLAFAFRDEDAELVGNLKQLLESHGIVVITGENLGGEELTPAVKEEIDNSDGLIAVLTGREKLAGGGWTTHPWVVDEMNYAIEKRKMAVALLEDGVALKGMAASRHHLQFDKGKQVKAILDVSEVVGKWKKKLGRTVKFQILPPSLATRLATDNLIKCKYKIWSKGNSSSEWNDAREARIAPEDFATFVYVDGVQDDQQVQLQVKDHGTDTEWLSTAKSQWMQIELSQKKPEQPK